MHLIPLRYITGTRDARVNSEPFGKPPVVELPRSLPVQSGGIARANSPARNVRGCDQGAGQPSRDLPHSESEMKIPELTGNE